MCVIMFFHKSGNVPLNRLVNSEYVVLKYAAFIRHLAKFVTEVTFDMSMHVKWLTENIS